MFSILQAAELAASQAALEERLNDIETKERAVQELHQELDSAKTEAQIKVI